MIQKREYINLKFRVLKNSSIPPSKRPALQVSHDMELTKNTAKTNSRLAP
jgi:hypothetical protein